MGGRIALHAAVQAAPMLSLTVIGATPGLRGESEREERIAADHQRAEGLLAGGLEPFLDAWLALPLFASLPIEAAFRSERLTNRADGLAASLMRRGTGQQLPLWDSLDTLTVPMAILAGSADDKFCALGASMMDGVGSSAQFSAVEGAGHAAHLEQPQRCVDLMIQTLSGFPG